MMRQMERVAISEYRIARAPVVLVAYGLGSCLGIAIHDPRQKIGGLAHTLLPAPRPGVPELRPTKFVDSAIRLMVADLLAQGAARERLLVKLVGGANMFEPLYLQAEEGIGARNIRAARETLQALALPLQGEDVGGTFGRTMEFDLESGAVSVRAVRRDDTILVL
jgi:chemotaxis protein CheD